MKTLKRYARLLVVLGMLPMFACSELTAPLDSLQGKFVLRSFDGVPLPALQYGHTYLAADTMTFDGRGHLLEVEVTTVDTAAHFASLVRQITPWNQYAVRGDTIDFRLTCPFGADCISPPVGWRLPDGGLVVAERRTTGFVYLRQYERVQ